MKYFSNNSSIKGLEKPSVADGERSVFEASFCGGGACEFELVSSMPPSFLLSVGENRLEKRDRSFKNFSSSCE